MKPKVLVELGIHLHAVAKLQPIRSRFSNRHQRNGPNHQHPVQASLLSLEGVSGFRIHSVLGSLVIEVGLQPSLRRPNGVYHGAVFPSRSSGFSHAYSIRRSPQSWFFLRDRSESVRAAFAFPINCSPFFAPAMAAYSRSLSWDAAPFSSAKF